MTEQDVWSPIDFCDPREALEWERTAQERPGRAEIFQAFVRELAGLAKSDLTVLELGSGPGFLAVNLLHALPEIRLTLLDFSAAMHHLARARLGPLVTRASFVQCNFKEPGWSKGLGRFDAVITNQAVHELRHKRHASPLHTAVREVVRPGGSYLVSDHFFGEGGFSNDRLYMTVAEQREALLNAGFSRVDEVASAGTLVMHRAI